MVKWQRCLRSATLRNSDEYPVGANYIATMFNDVLWIAQRHGQDWRDEASLAAVDWLTSHVPSADWEARLERTRQTFLAALTRWTAGDRAALFDPADLIAWYIFQATAYAADREHWVEHEAYRIAPVFRRLGQLLPDLQRIDGVGDRVARLMTGGKTTPDDGIYELLVAGAYASRGWTRLAFVPEQPGIARTHDLDVARGRARWAVECKRAGRSDYHATERHRAETIAALAHAICEDGNASLDIKIAFTDELTNIADRYLADHVAAFLNGGAPTWKDDHGDGFIEPIDWRPIQTVLQHDDVYFGSSRMIELLIGDYRAEIDYSVAGDWFPGVERPFHATTLNRATVISWISASEAAARRKARHFRSTVANAAGQLPGDRPGVVHVGYETMGGNTADGRRHRLNVEQMATFDPGPSRLQWVYGNYMTPEHTIARNESAALTETTATYPVRGRRNVEPLAGHMLFLDDAGVPGQHWRR